MRLTVAKYLGMVDRAERVAAILAGRKVDTLEDSGRRAERLYRLRVWVGDAREE